MQGSAFVTTRLSSTTMNRAIETIAKVQPVLAERFIAPPSERRECALTSIVLGS